MIHLWWQRKSSRRGASARRRARKPQPPELWQATRLWLRRSQTALFGARRQWLLGLLVVILSVLLGRAVFLQVIQKDFLQNQWDARHLRTVSVPAHRGLLMDREGEPVAISTPVESVWVQPAQFITISSQWQTLAQILGLSLGNLNEALAGRWQREFVYLKRHLSPTVAQQVKDLKLPGVFLQREYRRYYPLGEVTAQILGFTNIDEIGQEGLELALNDPLTGKPGTKQIVQDKQDQIIAQIANLQAPQPGQDIRLSLDRRLQYLAYRELKVAVLTSKAKAGAAIILDLPTGEVLAMVNQPVCNPNNRGSRHSEQCRNRAVTDSFEPGSTFKPFAIAAALESGRYTAKTRIDTRPGKLIVGENQILDPYNYGIIDVTTVLQKSSNVGASKIALSLPPKALWKMLNQLGFGTRPGSSFPGEEKGRLTAFSHWQPIDQASLAFGYGARVTLLQLARAYAAIGTQGQLPLIRFLPMNSTFEKLSNLNSTVMQPKNARQLLNMLETVVKPGGTGQLAFLPNVKVAGKTGTTRKFIDGKYSETQYLAWFVGLVPANAPRLVMAIVIDEPQGDNYYGGKIAAPIFAKVMSNALRLLNRETE